ncbi:MAG: hypothetical protein ABSC41_05775 [Acidimicrobiales bacterium]
MPESEKTSRLDLQKLPLKNGNLSFVVPELAQVSLGTKEPGVLWILFNNGTWPVSLFDLEVFPGFLCEVRPNKEMIFPSDQHTGIKIFATLSWPTDSGDSVSR